MKVSDIDETRAIVARERAKKFFDKLSERRQKARREQQELRIRQEILRKAEQNRYQAINEGIKELKKSSIPPEPPLPEPLENQQFAKPVSVDPATQDFLKWCFKQEEDDEPYWVQRSPRLYGRSH